MRRPFCFQRFTWNKTPMTITAFPLSWPDGWRRTPPALKRAALFGKQAVSNGADGPTFAGKRRLTVAEAIKRLHWTLDLVGGVDIVVSTNLALRLDGVPRSGQGEPADAGVAVYWRDVRHDRARPLVCMAVDRYTRVADNIAAIAATIDAMRAIERHGGAEILDRAFTGFAALPAPGREHWSDVLGVPPDATPSFIAMAYKRRRSETHPDNGGAAGEFERVQAAYERAAAERGFAP